MTKLLYCIRHGTALHNVNFLKIGRKAYTDFKDTPLIDKGKIEAIKLGTDWKDLFNVELVLVSPLSRTLDTAKYVFQNYDDVPIIALDELMEHPQAEELCNQRFDKTELVNRYPNIDFSNISDNPKIYWSDKLVHEKELVNLDNRINIFKEFVRKRPEKTIAIVSHSSLLGHMMHNKIGDENNELKHCSPYEYSLI
jgi:broad specificity phosphatase PhoE